MISFLYIGQNSDNIIHSWSKDVIIENCINSTYQNCTQGLKVGTIMSYNTYDMNWDLKFTLIIFNDISKRNIPKTIIMNYVRTKIK